MAPKALPLKTTADVLVHLCDNGRTLRFPRNFKGPALAVIVTAALKDCTSLTTLVLGVNRIGNEGAKALAVGLKDCPSLTTLDLNTCEIDDVGLAALVTSLKSCPLLTTLNLNTNFVGNEGAKALAVRLKDCPSLTTLNLHSNSIGDIGATALVEGLKYCLQFSTLDLGYNSIGVEAARALAAGLRGIPSLKNLSLSNNQIGDAGATALSMVLKDCVSLTTLDVSYNKIGADGATALAAKLKDCPTLTTFLMKYNRIGDVGAAALAAQFKEWMSFTTLDLAGSGFGTAGIAAVAAGLRDCLKLRKLDLRSNRIDDARAAVLAEGLKRCSSLTEINLSHNQIRNGGAATLSTKLQACSSLKTLDLSYNEIGDVGIASLAMGLKACQLLTTPQGFYANSVVSSARRIETSALEIVREDVHPTEQRASEENLIRRRAAEQRDMEQRVAEELAAVARRKATELNDLHRAARAGDSSFLKKCEPGLLSEPNEVGRATIHEAAASNSVASIDAVLARGIPIDARSQSMRTALHEAAQQNQMAAVKYLLKCGAMIDAVDRQGCTPLLLAVNDGHYEVARVLVEAGASLDISRVDGRSSMDLLRENAPDTLHFLRQVQSASGDLTDRLERELKQWDRIHMYTLEPTIDSSATTMAIRDGKLDLLDALPPEGSLQSLHIALICLSGSMFRTKHAEAALQEYEAQAGNKSPLLLLAQARVHARKVGEGAQLIRLGLLRRFIEYPDAAQWLTAEERDISESPYAPLPPHASAVVSDARSGIEAQWAAISSQLTAEQRKPMDELMAMVGMMSVKRIALSLYTDVQRDEELKKRGISPVPRTLNFAFVGNPGTGKTRCAKLFCQLLEQAGARAGHKFVSMTASEALRKGSRAFASELASLTGGTPGVGPPREQMLRRNMHVEVMKAGKLYPATIEAIDTKKKSYEILYADGSIEESVPHASVFGLGEKAKVGGVLFLDEAYDLDPQDNSEGRLILADIMHAAEEHRDTVSIILAGYKDDIERKLYSFNNGMPSRFQTVPFDDFNELQLAQIWRTCCANSKWTASQETTRVVARRLARGVGRKGFGNARSVRKLFDQATSAASAPPNITIEDILGKPPTRTNLPELDSALRELEAMAGLSKVKDAIYKLVKLAETNYRKELAAEEVTHIPLNRIFVGNPGCGKTTVAVIYGRVLKALRMLSNGEVVAKTSSDFIGEYVGESQSKTRQILEAAEGRVLIIDDAYNLDDDHKHLNGYGKQVLDTIVEKVSGEPGEDISVLMLGYRAQMQTMLRNQNRGLAQRFQPQNMLEFEDLSNHDLAHVFSNACDGLCIEAPLGVMLYAITRLSQQRNLPNFGNVRAVKNMIANAKLSMDARNSNEMTKNDIDANAELDPEQVLQELAGYDVIEKEMRRIASSIRVRQAEGRSLDGLVPNFVFTGSPGTGKTTVARAIARLLFAYGVLSSDKVLETSGAGLSGESTGQAKKIVRDKMEAARGGVLFIDEAYRLGKDSYGEEAVAALVEMLTLPEYSNGKTVVVLAGYSEEIHSMMQVNPGLKARFRKYVEFHDWDVRRCVEFVLQRAEKTFVIDDRVDMVATITSGFDALIKRPGWANGRDAVNVFELIVQERDVRVARDGPSGVLAQDAEFAFAELLAARPGKRPTGSPYPLDPDARDEDDSSVSLIVEDHGHSEETAVGGVGTDVKNHRSLGKWNGLYIEYELRPINTVVEHWSKDALDALRDGDMNALNDLVEAMRRNGVQEDEAKRIASKYVVALTELRRKEYAAKFLADKMGRKPIIRCQACGSTANYWAPCWVAPEQIGWEAAEDASS